MISFEGGQPSGDLLRLQATHKEMLAKLSRYCSERDISWFLVAGSALGAVREGDVIPWDDDVDVGLLRDDYDRLQQALQENPIPGLFFQDWQTEPGYWLSFAKLRLDGSRVEDVEFRGQGFHDGIFIDVFPFDRIPDSAWLQDLQRRTLGVLNLFIMPKLYEKTADNPGGMRRWAKVVAQVVAGVIPVRWLLRVREAVTRSGPTKSGRADCFGMFGASRYQRTQTTIQELVPPVSGHFGSLTVPLPNNADAYLTRLYGDYRRPPPAGARKPEHTSTVSFPGE